jgi:hypothetical protein
VSALKRVSGLRIWLGALVVAVQLGAVILTHTSSSCCAARYFAWAPNDYSVDYTITARVDGRMLNGAEVLKRYGLPQTGFWEDPPARLIHNLRAAELNERRGHDVVRLRYSLDGRPATVWTYRHD